MESNAVLKALDDAAQNVEENDTTPESSSYEWTSERTTVRAIIKRYNERKFSIPLCQRLYVWNEKQRSALHESVKHNLPCGNITIAEYNDHQYLIDGLQRLTSLILLSNAQELTKEEKTVILNYNVTSVTVHGFQSENDISNYFRALNSGTAVASIVKARATLPEHVQSAVLSISGMPYFKSLSEKANATFSKNHHHEIIAMAALQAACNLGGSAIKASKLVENLTNSEKSVTDITTQKAKHIIGRIASAFAPMEKRIVKRAANANYLAVLAFVLFDHPEVTAKKIQFVTETIFASGKAIKEYSTTTGSNAADVEKVKQRGQVIAKMLAE